MSLVDTMESDHVFLPTLQISAFWLECFQGTATKRQIQAILRVGLGRAPNLSPLPPPPRPVAVRLLVFTATFVVRLLDFKVSKEIGRERCYEAGTAKLPFLLRFHSFS